MPGTCNEPGACGEPGAWEPGTSGERRRRRGRQRGYMLLIVLLAFALLALSLAMAAPGWITAIKRRREQTAIDYARQYCMGIRRYYHKFGTYPPNLDRLQATNDIHYLRRAWPDPLAQDGKWYFIHPGDLIAPKVQGAPGQNTPGGLAGAGSAPGGASGPTGPTSPTGLAGAMGSAGVFGATSSASLFGATGPAASPSANGPGPAVPGGTVGAGGPLGFALPPTRGGAIDGIEVLTNYRLRKQDSSFATVGGGPIIGVAILNSQPAVHQFSGQDVPARWLFIYDPAADRSLGGAAPQGPAAPAANSPNGSSPFGGPTSNPFGSPAASPTGNPPGGPSGLPAGNPFGGPPAGPVSPGAGPAPSPNPGGGFTGSAGQGF